MFRLILVLLSIPAICHAVPEVTFVQGEISDGNSVIIEGTGFGDKATPQPLTWCDFEFGTPPNQITTADVEKHGFIGVYRDDTQSGGYPWYSSAIARGGRPTITMHSKFMQPDPFGGNQLQYLFSYIPQLKEKRIFISFWCYYKWTYSPPDVAGNPQLNHFFVYNSVPDATRYLKWPSVGRHVGPNTDPPRYQFYFPTSECENANPVSPRIYDGNTSTNTDPPDNTWTRWTIEIYQGTAGVVNQWMRVWHGSNQIHTWMNTPGHLNWQGYAMTNASCFMDALQIPRGTSFAPTGLDVDQYYDDIYIDNTFARIEIGNNQYYDQCSVREMQYPVFWSPTVITATLNQGQFADGAGAWLFVIDATGARPVQGLAITWGEEAVLPCSE